MDGDRHLWDLAQMVRDEFIQEIPQNERCIAQPIVAKSSSVAHSSGATSSHLSPHFDMISRRFLTRLGVRCSLGDRDHGRGNWMRAFELVIETPRATDRPQPSSVRRWRYDIDFLRDRYNHACEHLLALRDGAAEDDHIGAIGWFLSFASYAEECGVDWSEVLAVRTPEDEAEYRGNYQILSARKEA